MDTSDWLLAPAGSWSERVLRLRVFINEQMRAVEDRHAVVSDDLRGNVSRQESSIVGQMQRLEGALRYAANQLRSMGDTWLSEQAARLEARRAVLDPRNGLLQAQAQVRHALEKGDQQTASYWMGVCNCWCVVLGDKAQDELTAWAGVLP